MQETAEVSRKEEGTGARLGSQVTINRWKGHKVYKWRASYIECGQHKRKGFKTEKAAEKWKEGRENDALKHGTETALSAAERSVVNDTRERLKSVGIDLRTAVDFAANYFETAEKSCTVTELKNRMIEERERSGQSERYLQDLRSRLGQFEKVFGSRSVATITKDEIFDWLQSLNRAPVTRNNFRRCLVVMFTDAVDGGYLAENTAAKVKPAKVIEAEPDILSPADIGAILEKAGPDILPALAIGAFAGVRDAEIKKLDWSDVRFEKGHEEFEIGYIRIRSGVAKSARNRLIPISKNLEAWIKPHTKREGKVWPKNGKKVAAKLRRSIGYGTPGSETEEEKEKGVELIPWPKNALRHSYASYWLAEHQNAEKLAGHMGHRGTDLIYTNYRAVVTPGAASKYWAISPEQPENIVHLAS